MVGENSVIGRPVRFAVIGVALASVSCSPQREEPVQSPLDHAPDPGWREDPESIKIAAYGKYPDVVFSFTLCTTGQPARYLRTIHFVRNSHVVCRVHGDGLPPTWRYGTPLQDDDVTCAPLSPGHYGITVFADWRGEAEFTLAQDGAVTLEDVLCSNPRAGKQSNGSAGPARSTE